MAVKRRLPAGAHSTPSSSGEATPTSGIAALEESTHVNPELWNTENELKLLQALITHKPTGISKHFQMALILNKLSQGKQTTYSLDLLTF